MKIDKKIIKELSDYLDEFNLSEIEYCENNIKYKVFVQNKLVVFIAIKDIEEGQELLTWWGQSYYNSWCKKK